MSQRVTLPVFHAVRRMLRSGLRHSEIAREAGLSVWTIGRLANSRQFERDDLSESDLPEDDAPPGYEAQNLRRCAGCGGMVYQWPCLTCEARSRPAPLPTSYRS